MKTIPLDENSNRIIQPNNLKIKLKEHQLTSIYAMNELENNGKINRNIKSCIYKFQIYDESAANYYWLPDRAKNLKNIDYTIETNFGILSDIVGSGKTYIVMGLLNHNLLTSEKDKIFSTSTYSCLKYKDNQKSFKTNLIIVPHNLVTQWKNAFSYCNLKTYVIAKKSDINYLEYPENLFTDELNVDDEFNKFNTIEYYDVIICSSTMIDDYYTKFNIVKYSRIIIDEVCSIKLPADLNWDANFIWFITATPSGINYLKKLYIREIVSKMHKLIFDNIIIKNNDEYVSKSMSLPNLNQILIKCFTPKELEMVREFVPKEVMDMLNAGNMKEAIFKLNCNIDTDDNILQVLTNKISKEIHNKKAELTYQETIIPTDKKAHDESISKLKDKINSLQTKYDSISIRIKDFNKENCPICLEEFASSVPGILPCCNQIFCITCLALINGTCPMCRISFKMNNVSVIMNDYKNDKNNKLKNNVKQSITKIDALIKIIKDKPNGRFLLFSNYDQTFDNLINRMTNEKIKFSKVMGSNSVINKIIERFTNNEIRVLMLNATNYGSGLNLQMATDIIIYHQLPLELETQVIGRAQRIGRTEPLNIYYLLHEHEQNNVTNPVLSLDLENDDDIIQLDKYLGKEVINVSKDLINYEIDFNDIPPEIFGTDTVTIKPKKKKVIKKNSINNSMASIEI
jgi:hypothetical protein